MRNKLLYLFLCFCCFHGILSAQSLELVSIFPVDAPTAVSADNQGHVYIATREGEIKKHNLRGLLLYTFSPQSAGFFNVVDGSSSMQVKAFSENSQSIVYLDRFLNETARFRLPTDPFSYISSLCWSAGNTIWLAGTAEMQLAKWSVDTREVLRTINLNQFITGDNFEISMIKEHQHKIYLFSPDRLYIFSQPGNYEKQIPLEEWKGVAFSEKEIIMLGNESLTFLELYGVGKRKIPLPAEKYYSHITFSKGDILLFSRQEAHIYRSKP